MTSEQQQSTSEDEFGDPPAFAPPPPPGVDVGDVLEEDDDVETVDSRAQLERNTGESARQAFMQLQGTDFDFTYRGLSDFFSAILLTQYAHRVSYPAFGQSEITYHMTSWGTLRYPMAFYALTKILGTPETGKTLIKMTDDAPDGSGPYIGSGLQEIWAYYSGLLEVSCNRRRKAKDIGEVFAKAFICPGDYAENRRWADRWASQVLGKTVKLGYAMQEGDLLQRVSSVINAIGEGPIPRKLTEPYARQRWSASVRDYENFDKLSRAFGTWDQARKQGRRWFDKLSNLYTKDPSELDARKLGGAGSPGEDTAQGAAPSVPADDVRLLADLDFSETNLSNVLAKDDEEEGTDQQLPNEKGRAKPKTLIQRQGDYIVALFQADQRGLPIPQEAPPNMPRFGPNDRAKVSEFVHSFIRNVQHAGEVSGGVFPRRTLVEAEISFVSSGVLTAADDGTLSQQLVRATLSALDRWLNGDVSVNPIDVLNMGAPDRIRPTLSVRAFDYLVSRQGPARDNAVVELIRQNIVPSIVLDIAELFNASGAVTRGQISKLVQSVIDSGRGVA